jgi:S-layer protein (TIGR01567 family)
MIILIALALLAMVGAASAGTAVDEVEIHGTVVEADGAGNLRVAGSGGIYQTGYTWDPYTFGAFWYELDDDLSSESLSIETRLDDRTITDKNLTYMTHPVPQNYAYYRDMGYPLGMVNGKQVTQYSIEGWMAEKYVAISTGGSTVANANKLSKLLLEFESSSDKKLLLKGVPWDLGEGFSLNVTYISSDGYVAVLLLEKNGEVLDETVIETHMAGDRRYMYTEDISGVSDVVVFFCYVDAVSPNPGLVQLKYVYLIDNDILKISSGDTYGNMEVKTASGTRVTLKNDGDIDLSKDADVEIMGDMYFNVADSDTVRFYPYKVYTGSGDHDVRGTVLEANYAGGLRVAGSGSPYYSGYTWDPYTFAVFWYDLDDDLCTESLSIDALLDGRTITEDNLIYTTTPHAQDYKYYKDMGEALGNISGNPVTNYATEGWMAEECVAISTGGSTAANANKLARLLIEFESSKDWKILAEGEPWDLGGGFTLNVTQLDLGANAVTLSLAKNNVTLNETVIDACHGDRRYMYAEDLSGVNDVVVFFCYVNAVFRGPESNLTQLKYVYLIDNDVEKIDTGTTYGNMEVKTASSSQIVLKNDGDIDLTKNTDVEIMNDMYFKVADSDTVRFYPFVERTINGTVPTPPETIPADDVDDDGVPDVWDMDNSTPQGYWTDSDGIGRRWGDMNGDGKLTSVDALMILQAVAGKIDIG